MRRNGEATTGLDFPTGHLRHWLGYLPDRARLADVARAAGPPLLFGLRLWASVCLALFVAFKLELDNAYWAGTSAAIVCQPQLGASLRKGWFRMVGTLVGAVAIVALTAWAPQDRALFLVGLAVWGAGCALVATLLKNFAAYAAALAGYTAAIIASDQLGATGGLNGHAFMLAVTRTTEICIGIVSSGIVLAGTDFGGAPRQIARLIASLSAEITAQFSTTLARAGSDFARTRRVRHEFLRKVIALDPVIDEVIGESSQLRYHSPVLQRAVYGLFDALGSWRIAAVLLSRLPDEQASPEARDVLACVPAEFRVAAGQGETTPWITSPTSLRQTCDSTIRTLTSLPAATPSLRLLADQAAVLFLGVSRALDALALLTADPARTVARHRGMRRLHIPDWLPSLINAGRAFVTICAVEILWIVTQWPSGAAAITWAAVGVILLAPRADQAYTAALGFMMGTVLGAVLAAIIAFAVLPEVQTFVAFSLAIGAVLVPAGAGIAQPWQKGVFTGLALNFVPLVAPANQMSYDTAAFYNNALGIVGGLAIAALSFRLLPPLSSAACTGRLLALTLRDLRRLVSRPIQRTTDDWQSQGYSRLSALPDGANPRQRARLLAGLSVGSDIIQLRRTALLPGQHTDLDVALGALAHGDIAVALARLASLDGSLAGAGTPTALVSRARILAISQALNQHAAYFESGAAL
jgi:uncharacterized membrane protein YccC